MTFRTLPSLTFPNLRLMDSQALPPGIGPKICPFPDRRAEISFLDLLNPGENPRSYVFKVRINGRIYALKIVRSRYNIPVSRVIDEMVVR